MTNKQGEIAELKKERDSFQTNAGALKREVFDLKAKLEKRTEALERSAYEYNHGTKKLCKGCGSFKGEPHHKDCFVGIALTDPEDKKEPKQ